MPNLKRTAFWSGDDNVEISGVVVVRNCRYAGDRLLHQPLSLLKIQKVRVSQAKEKQ
jgi:hypothetical protein